MSLDKLKDAARKFEQKEDWRRAIEVYLKAIQEIESGKDASPDLGLYNRVGDLYLKMGDTASAVRHYERAVDLYADQGFFNNAIALCGKLLRVNPGRTQIYLKLAQLHARKNVVIEAKRNLLEFIERMHAQGQLDEAFAAVKGFADQFSGSQDIRLMLIELLRASSRADEAQAELDKLCLELEGRNGNTPRRSRERMDAPVIEAEASAGQTKRSGDLVFLDTGSSRAPSAAKPSGRKSERPALHDLIPEGLLVVEPPVEAEAASEAGSASAEPPRGAPAGEADLAAVEPGSDLGAAASEAAEPGAAEAALDDPVGGPAEMPGPPVEPIEGLMPGGADDLVIVHDDPGGFETTVLNEPAPDAGPVARVETVEGLIEAGRELGATDLQLERDEPLELQGMRLGGLLGDDLAPGTADAELGDLGAPPAATPLPAPESIELDLVDERAPPAPPVVPVVPPDRPASAAPRAGPPSIEELEQAVLDRPDDPAVHRALAEALLREGGVARAVEEFELAASMYEFQEAWDDAGGMMARVIELEPGSIRHHQRRVEYAFRSGSRTRLIEAYLSLAEALVEVREPEKAVAVYRHVLGLDPVNRRAHDGLAGLAPPERRAPSGPAGSAAPEASSAAPAAPAPEAPRKVEAPRKPEPPGQAEAQPGAEAPRNSEAPPAAPAPPAPPAAPAPPQARPAAPRPPAAESEFVDLGSLVRDEEGPRDTRMRLEGARPTEDEQRNFEEMLAAFKRGIEQNLEDEDYQAHYDLGVAFKEMGLLDEAIAEFQKALRAPEVGARLRASEALGVAFFDKGQFGVAESVLRRAVDTLDGADDAKVALLYWLGRAAEAQGKAGEALTCYERAMAVDIRFLDLGQRVGRLASGRRS